MTQRQLLLREVIKRIDADALGEFLRAVTFVGSGLGCYETFGLVPGVEKLPVHDRIKWWKEVEQVADEFAIISAERGDGCRFELEGYQITMCYYWEGDGVLSFKIEDVDEVDVLTWIINGDCKKTYRWEHLKDY